MQVLSFKKKDLFKVCWKTKNSKLEGSGQPISEDAAYESAAYANKEWPDLFHWVEPIN